MTKINWKFTGHCRPDSLLQPKAYSWWRWAKPYADNEMCTREDLVRWSVASKRQPTNEEREVLIGFMQEVGLPFEDQAYHFASLEGDYTRATIAFAKRLEDMQDLTDSDWVFVQRYFTMYENGDFEDAEGIDDPDMWMLTLKETFPWLEQAQLGDDNIYDTVLS